MKLWTSLTAVLSLSISAFGLEGCPPVRAETALAAAPLSDSKTIVDTFQPFAFGTAIRAEEWIGDQQITSTVFYLVGSELWADQ
jgi:hypothetical protein